MAKNHPPTAPMARPKTKVISIGNTPYILYNDLLLNIVTADIDNRFISFNNAIS